MACHLCRGTNKIIFYIPSLYYKFSTSIKIFRSQNLKSYFKICYAILFYIKILHRVKLLHRFKTLNFNILCMLENFGCK